LEHTIPDLQAQVDQLTLALRQWRESRDHVQPVEAQLRELADRCTEIISRWSVTSERHARAVAEVESTLQHWSTIEHRLEEDATSRVREFSEIVRREWEDLRRIHEEPVKQLRDQAAALGETCMAAASLSVRGFERTEARLAALETDLHARLHQLSRDIQSALAPVTARPAPVTPFPLDGVMRIHEELRGAATPLEMGAASDAASPEALTDSRRLLERVDSIERELSTEKEEVRRSASAADRMLRNWRTTLAVAVAAIVVIGYFGWRLQQYVDGRLNDAAARVSAAEQQAQAIAVNASREVSASRSEAERQIAEARGAALQAQLVSTVMVAPDLIRFNLGVTDKESTATAQALWSRTSGLVLSASRLAAAPTGTTYQIWLMSYTVPIAAGQFTPDRNGRVTVAFENPAEVPRPITGVMVTIEPAGGSQTPSSTPVLVHPPQ
jgi:hypothetical protein